MFVKQSDLNEFTRVVKDICLKEGKCHVKLRDGQWRDVVYRPADEEECCSEGFVCVDGDLHWNMDGSSIHRRDLCMVEIKEEAQPMRPFWPPLAEGARFLHDLWSDEFLGQFEDADLYACFTEHVREGRHKGFEAGRYGSLFRFRCSDRKELATSEMLGRALVSQAGKVEDPYLDEAYRLAKERGWILTPEREGWGECLFIPKEKS
jgi:hypothetical protein